MKIVITGANGQLGRDLQEVWSEHDLYPVDLDELDITDFNEVRRQISDFAPDLILHAAAFTDVDGAELTPERAYAVNGVGTQNLAVAAEATGADILYVSTDFVFDGRKGEAYDEFDKVSPLNVYGRSKWAGESYVTLLTNRFYICRTAWLYGRHGHNFVKTMVKLGEEGKAVRVVDDQVGSPTFSLDLAIKIKEIAASGRYGVYHTTNSGSVSWYGFAQKIFELAGLDVELTPTTSAEFKRPAARPAYSVLRPLALELQGMAPMRPWQEALADYFQA